MVGRAGVRRLDVGGEVTALAVGENDMLALRSDGQMWRWRGLSGEAWQESWPAATAVAVSAELVCVQLRDGQVKCRGLHDFASSPTVMIPEARGARSIVGAGRWMYALTADGAMGRWGWQRPFEAVTAGAGAEVRAFATNGQSVVIAGARAPAGAPASVPPLVELAVDRGGRSCGRSERGEVICWRWAESLPVGQSTHGPGAVVLDLPGPVARVVAGDEHMCARTQRGEVWCWGSNRFGQVGDGTFGATLVPTRVEGAPADPREVVWTDAAGCALDGRGAVTCWGRDLRWDGPRTLDSAPQLRTMTATRNGICGLTADDALLCGEFIADRDEPTWASPVPLRDTMAPRRLAGADSWVCAGGDGGLGCWRFALDVEGVLKIVGTAQTRRSDVIDRLAAHTFLYGVDADGRVLSWRPDRQAHLPGLDTTRPLAGLPNSCHEVVPAFGTLCARCGEGKVLCSGLTFTREPEAATEESAVTLWTRPDGLGVARGIHARRSVEQIDWTEVPGRYAALVGGSEHFCGLAGDGRVACWGENEAGQLGDGTADRRWPPAPPIGLPGPVEALWAARGTTCARTGEELWCWGRNDHGQVGDGRSGDYRRPRRFDHARCTSGPLGADGNRC
ncbi:RCC1 domain-containing protein [Nannocystis pusilla]|uniref:RCC1 domain-containing protein n=1 Tax=Nannocystis pusilla TaxID=889268 RepID=UPI003BF25F5C